MTLVDTQWAVKSILQLGHHHLRSQVMPSITSISACSPALRVTAAPRLMQSADGTRLLLLAKRPDGIAGVEIGHGERVPWKTSTAPALGVPRGTDSKKARRLLSYLQRRGFATLPVPPRSTAAPQAPLVLHTNPYIGWKLQPGSAACPLYAHSIAELLRLRSKELFALQPQECLISTQYTEWDNWREVLGEPGWDLFSASDDALARILHDGVAAPLVENSESGFSKVEVLF